MKSKKSLRHSLNLKTENYYMLGTSPYIYVVFYSFPSTFTSVFLFALYVYISDSGFYKNKV